MRGSVTKKEGEEKSHGQKRPEFSSSFQLKQKLNTCKDFPPAAGCHDSAKVLPGTSSLR